MNVIPAIKKILYCTQIGPNSAYIFRYAVAMADRFQARITVLHVVSSLTPEQEAIIDGYIGPASIHDVVEQAEKSAEARVLRHLEVFCSRTSEGYACRNLVEGIRIREGAAAEGILAEATECGADLIVMGAHATSSLIDSIMGSTAQKVIKKAPVPVLVVQVPEGQQELTTPGI